MQLSFLWKNSTNRKSPQTLYGREDTAFPTLADTWGLTLVIGNTVCSRGSITASCCHVQKRLDDFNSEYSIFLPKVQHTDYFTLLSVRKHEHTINICINNSLHLTEEVKTKS